MRWVVIGDKGLFGSEMVRHLRLIGEEVQGFNRLNLNLEDSIADIYADIGEASVIVNAVAFTNVDGAETSSEEALKVNSDFAEKLAKVAQIKQTKFIHISTDYVFNSPIPMPIGIDAKTNPINVYGVSKALGEKKVLEAYKRATVMRTSWLYGPGGNGFVQKVATHLREQGRVQVVDDQFGTPTWSSDLARWVFEVVTAKTSEQIVHAVPQGFCSRFEFANEIAQSLDPNGKLIVERSKTQKIDGKAVRPTHSILQTRNTESWLERWKVAAPEVLAEFLTD